MYYLIFIMMGKFGNVGIGGSSITPFQTQEQCQRMEQIVKQKVQKMRYGGRFDKNEMDISCVYIENQL